MTRRLSLIVVRRKWVIPKESATQVIQSISEDSESKIIIGFAESLASCRGTKFFVVVTHHIGIVSILPCRFLDGICLLEHTANLFCDVTTVFCGDDAREHLRVLNLPVADMAVDRANQIGAFFRSPF